MLANTLFTYISLHIPSSVSQLNEQKNVKLNILAKDKYLGCTAPSVYKPMPKLTHEDENAMHQSQDQTFEISPHLEPTAYLDTPTSTRKTTVHLGRRALGIA